MKELPPINYKQLYENMIGAFQRTQGRDNIYRAPSKRVPYKTYGFIQNLMRYVEPQVECVLQHISRQKEYSFLDVGCGIGNIMLMVPVALGAYKFGRIDGIELRAKYAKIARGHYPYWDCKSTVFIQNALSFNRYGKYDIIYFYNPINDHEVEERLERRIVCRAKVGALFMANSLREHTFRQTCRSVGSKYIVDGVTLQYLGNKVWKKVS